MDKLTPNKIFILISEALGLSHDEKFSIFRSIKNFNEIEENEKKKQMLEIKGNITPSRITAWKTGKRNMTWLELEIFLIGLKSERNELFNLPSGE